MKKPPANITDAELEVMKLLWDSGPLLAREIRDQLYPDGSESSHGTVQKLLQRLEKKGFVSRDRSSFAHVFHPEITQQAYAGRQFQSLAEKLTDGSVVPFLTHLVEAKGISRSDLNKLRKLFDDKSGK